MDNAEFPHKKKKNVPHSGTIVQKLQFFYTLAVEQLNNLQFTLNNQVRYRGDTLELFINPTNASGAAQESKLYVKTGILITLLYQIIEYHGYKPVIRTFPRFDEQNLVAFIFLGNQNVSLTGKKKTFPLFTVPEKCTPSSINKSMLDTFSRTAHYHAMSYYHIKGEGERKQIIDFLNAGRVVLEQQNGKLAAKPPPPPKINACILDDLKKNPVQYDLILIGSEQNNSSSWLKTGLFIGDIMLKALAKGNFIYPVNLDYMTPTMRVKKPVLSGYDFNHHHLILYSSGCAE